MGETEAAGQLMDALAAEASHMKASRRFWDAVAMERWRREREARRVAVRLALAAWLEARWRAGGVPLEQRQRAA